MDNQYTNYHEQPPVILQPTWRAALYIRLSKEDGNKNESNSVTNQREILINFVEKQPDISVVDIFVDDGFSGTNFNRPDFTRMMEMIKTGEINCIIVKDLSRFARNNSGASYLIDDDFPKRRVRLIAVNDAVDYDPENPKDDTQNISIGVINLLNEHYARSTSKSAKSTLDIHRKHGKFIGAFPSYGYLKDPDDHHRLIVDDEAAKTVQFIFDKFLSGMSILGITKELNRLGVPNPSAYKRSKGWNYQHSSANSDGLWCDQTVRRILSNEMYIGNMVQGKNKSVSFKEKKCKAVPKQNWIIVPDTHAPIISKATFDKVQMLLKSRTKISQKSGNLDLFAGLLKCADCGRALSKKTNKHSYGTYIYYRCVTQRKMDKGACSTHSIRADYLELAVLRAIQLMVAIAVDMDKAINELTAQKKKEYDNSFDQKLLNNHKKELERQKKTLFGAYSDWKNDIISKDNYLFYKDEAEKNIEKLSQQIATLENNQSVPSANNDFVEEFKKYKNIRHLSRPILLELVDSILLKKDGGIIINFKFTDAYKEALEIIQHNSGAEEAA